VPSDLGVSGPATSSKAEQAYELIRGRIIDGTYGPGVRLVLDQLARETKVSQLPIREAVRRLEAEGYVVYERNVGAQVASIDPRRYAETMQALAVIEAAATSLAVPALLEVDLSEAKRINGQMRESLEEFDPVRFTYQNQEFHRVLYARCQNAYLVELVDREWDRMAAIRRSTFSFVPGRAREAVGEHDELVRLIESGRRADDVEDYARAHRMNTVNSFLRRYGEGPINAASSAR
jgi:DNA-binding GntR family transcriptional regulator